MEGRKRFDEGSVGRVTRPAAGARTEIVAATGGVTLHAVAPQRGADSSQTCHRKRMPELLRLLWLPWERSHLGVTFLLELLFSQR